MLGTLSAAASQDRAMGAGKKWSLGLEKVTPQHNFTLNVQGAHRNYRELGWDSSTLPNRMQLSASYGYNSIRFGTVGVALAKINTFNQGNLNTFSANYSMRVGARGTLSFTATRVTGQTSGTSVGVSLFFPLEKNVTLAASATRSNGNVDTYVSASRPLTTEVGSGWRALSGTRSGSVYSEGGYYYQGNKGQLSADASFSSAQQTLRLGAKGGLVMMDGQFFASRTIQNNSFALIEVPGYADVSISFQGSNRGYTNQKGQAFVTDLQPYQENRIQLDPKTLPINAAFDNLEQIVVPSANTGVKVVFPVNQGRAALIQIILDTDKQPAPIGAEIELLGANKTFFVARKGLAFVTDLQANNHLRMKWHDQQCELSIVMPDEKQDDITRIGPVTCMGVTR
jgi:outer membrane usher protein